MIATKAGGTQMTSTIPQESTLATRRGKLILALLASVAFIDFVDASIVNIALPSIRRDLGFSEQALQWVPSAYLLTYGGFMLLGGRAADLLGRRRILVAGTVLIGISSLICHGENPATVTDGVVDELRAREDEGGFVKLERRARFAPGDKIRVIDGIFSACLGLFEGMPDAEAVVTHTFTEKDGRTTLSLLVQHTDQAGRDAHINSGMEGGMQEAMDHLEQIAISLA